MTLSTVIIVAAALVGLLLGSFLNVCIARLPEGESVVSPGSRCPACSHPVRWFDNVPVASYLLLRARCRDCGSVISLRYPAVELFTSLWFLVSFMPIVSQFGLPFDPLLRLGVSCASDAALGFFLIGLAVMDWRTQILPDAFTIGGTFTGLLFTCAQAVFLSDSEQNIILKRRININSANAGRSPGNIFLTGTEHLIFGRLLAVVAAFLLLYLIRAAYHAVRKQHGMGLGDAKLLAMIAAIIGFEPALVALCAGVLLATAYAVTLLARGRANSHTPLPFGSFLAVGGLLAGIYGDEIASRYSALFR